MSLALQWSSLTDLSDLDTDQQCQETIGNVFDIVFTCVTGAVDVTTWTLAALIAPNVDAGPYKSWTDASFNTKTVGGSFTLSVVTTDTHTLPGRSYYLEVRRVDGVHNDTISKGFITLSPSPSFTPLPPPAGTVAWSRITDTPTTLAGYGITDVIPGTGTVTSVSVATANGFSGTVATATTTPVITIVPGSGITLDGLILTGVPVAPTASLGTNTTQVATCAFVLANASAGGATWGSIVGTLSSQSDLQTALNAKLDSDATLTALAGQNWALNTVPVGTGVDTVSQLALTTNTVLGRSASGNVAAKPVTDLAFTLLNNATALAMQMTVGVVPGGTYAGQSLKVVRVNAAETALELAAITGTGTVTNTGGVLTSNAVVLGAAGADVKVVAGITTDGVSVINLGVANTTIGKIKLFGNTSGDATIQPAAVAGTATVLTLPATTGTLALTSGNITGSAATLTTSRNLWGQAFNGSADITGSLTSVGDITGGASSMTITAGTGNSRTITFRTTNGSGTPVDILLMSASGTASFFGGVFSDGQFNSDVEVVAGTFLQCGTVLELGHATDTTLSRSAAGKIAVEGKAIPLMSGAFDAVFAGPTAARTYTLPDADTTFGFRGFAAHKNGTNQTGITPATFIKVTFTTEAFDVGGYYDAANSKWTPPAGKVAIYAAVCNDGANSAAGDFMLTAVYKNGSQSFGQAGGQAATNGEQAYSVFVEDDANGTDYYEVYVFFSNSGSDKTIKGAVNRTRFQGYVL